MKKSIGKKIISKKYWKTIILKKGIENHAGFCYKPTKFSHFALGCRFSAFLPSSRATREKKKLGGKAFNVRVCREAVADRFPGIPGSLVETSVP